MRECILIYDHETDRMDIRFGLPDFYGGLHCGERLEVNNDGNGSPLELSLGPFDI